MIEQTPEERVNHLRRLLHIHSVMYYFMNTSVVPDSKFDEWALELVDMNEKHPEFKHTGYMPSLFADWTGDTGMHLPVTDHALARAEALIEMFQTRQ